MDLVTALVSSAHVMLLCSPGATEAVMGWAAAQGDGLKVAATDVSSRCVMLSLIGPEAEVVLRELAEVRQGSSGSWPRCDRGPGTGKGAGQTGSLTPMMRQTSRDKSYRSGGACRRMKVCRCSREGCSPLVRCINDLEQSVMLLRAGHYWAD